MTEQQLVERFPNASKSFIKANATINLRSSTTKEPRQVDIHPDDTGPVAKLERDPRVRALAALPVQKGATGKVHVRITSNRKRLLDEDNCCCKFHIDLLRYAGIIPGDTPAQAKIEIVQEKTEPGAGEYIKIEVFEL